MNTPKIHEDAVHGASAVGGVVLGDVVTNASKSISRSVTAVAYHIFLSLLGPL